MMAKRFTDTMKWEEDWYLDLSLTQKLFWIYICDNCNHAGIFRPNKRLFEMLIGDKINLEKFLAHVNEDRLRISILANGRWYITGFIEFQYGSNLNANNRVHKTILKLLNDNDLNWDGEIQQPKQMTRKESTKQAEPKTISEVVDFFLSKGSTKKDGEKFYYFYESNGWKVGKNKMKNWKMAASGWVSRDKQTKPDADYLGGQLQAMKS